MNDNLEENFAYTDWEGDTHALDWTEKLMDKSNNPKLMDEDLKKMTCSHIEKDRFFSRDGASDYRCKACGAWDSDTIQPLKGRGV